MLLYSYTIMSAYKNTMALLVAIYAGLNNYTCTVCTRAFWPLVASQLESSQRCVCYISHWDQLRLNGSSVCSNNAHRNLNWTQLIMIKVQERRVSTLWTCLIYQAKTIQRQVCIQCLCLHIELQRATLDVCTARTCGLRSLHATCMISYSGLPASCSHVKNVWWSWADRFMS